MKSRSLLALSGLWRRTGIERNSQVPNQVQVDASLRPRVVRCDEHFAIKLSEGRVFHGRPFDGARGRLQVSIFIRIIAIESSGGDEIFGS